MSRGSSHDRDMFLCHRGAARTAEPRRRARPRWLGVARVTVLQPPISYNGLGQRSASREGVEMATVVARRTHTPSGGVSQLSRAAFRTLLFPGVVELVLLASA